MSHDHLPPSRRPRAAAAEQAVQHDSQHEEQHDSQHAEQPDEQLQHLLHDTYRQLEHAYHHSVEYGLMVERYPVLARSIAVCRHIELVEDPPAHRRRGRLRWDRSHGEL